jgi:hypothetical protein
MHDNRHVFGCALFVHEQTISSYVRRQMKLKKIGLKLDVCRDIQCRKGVNP